MRSLASVFAFPLTFVLFGLSGTAPWSAEHVPAPEINVDAPVQGSVESALNAAVSLFTQGEVEAAIDAVRPYLSEDARTVDMLFEVGMITLGAAQTTPPSDAVGRDALLDSSIAVFRAILAAHPEFVRVRLELARAFFLKGRYGLARRNFELALAANPPAPVVANINRHLAMIQARRRWSGYFGMALAPDTNIGAAEDNETILLNPFGGEFLEFIRGSESRVQSGIGLSLWAGGEYQQPLAPNWRLRLGGDVSRREYEGSRFDSMRLGGHVGPRWLVDARTEASLLFTTHRDWTENDKPYSRSLGFRLEAFRRLSPRLSGQLDASWRARRHDTSKRRDGPVTDLSIGLRRAMTPTLQANVRAGLVRERPEEKDLRNRTQWLSLGASSTLPRGFNVSGTLTGRWTGYEGPGSPPNDVLDETPRKDVTRSIRLSALKRDFTIRGFSPQISVIRERRDSNAQQSDFRRTGGDLSFVRQF